MAGIQVITGIDDLDWKQECFGSVSHKTIKPIEITVFSVVGLLLNIYSFKNSDLFCKLVCFCKVVFTLARISPGHDVCCVNATCLCTVIFFPTHFSPTPFGYLSSALSQQVTLIIHCKVAVSCWLKRFLESCVCT